MKVVLTLGLLLSPSSLPAQPPAISPNSFLREYSQTRGFLLGRPQKASFSHDGKVVLFLRSSSHDKVQRLYQLDLASGQTSELASPASFLGGRAERLSVEEKARRERLRLQTSGFSDYYANPQNESLLLQLSGRLYLFDRLTRKVQILPVAGPLIDPQWSPDGRKIAYVRGYDIYMWDVQKGNELQLSRGGSLERTQGLAEFVAQEEMQRQSGFWWSPDSRKIAFEQADYRGVEIWNISDPSKPEVAPQRQFYPRPGKRNVHARLGILEIGAAAATAVVWSDRPAWAEYLAAVRWDQQGPLTVQWQDRSQRTLELDRVQAATGKLHRLLYQQVAAPGWINLHQNLPVWLPGAKQFLCYRIEDGLEKLCLVEAEGGGSRTLLPAEGRRYDVTEFVHFDAKSGLLDCRIDETPGDPRAISLGLHGGQVRLDSSDGVSELAVSRDGRLRLVTSHTLAHLPQTRVIDREGAELYVLPSVAAEPEVTTNFSFLPLKDEHGALLFNAAVVKPRQFDPALSYPVIVDVYGGPRHLHVVQSQRNWLIDQWLADQGFLVVAVDGRGTPGRGLAFEWAIFGKFGQVPLEDQIKGVKLLAQRIPQLDVGRVGIVGWSFGGYLSALAVLKRPDFFQAAVAGAPVTDWLDYDTHYTERYMGLLPAAARAYADSSLLPLPAQPQGLKSPLLLVHGSADDNVYFRNSLRLADSLTRAGQEFEFLPLAGITHSYSADATITERLWLRSAKFFHEHLGQPRSGQRP